MFISMVNWEKCTGCGDCVRVCPADCFQMTGQGKSDPHRATSCIDCGNCTEACTEDAIVISMGWGGYKLPARRH